MSAWLGPAPEGWHVIARLALEEDLGAGDLTAACLPEGREVGWYIEAQAPGRLCGVEVARYVLEQGGALVSPLAKDGDVALPGLRVLEGRALVAGLLSHERTALNFLMLLSGVATLTSMYVDAVRHTRATIIDTRKTSPGMRTLQKYAVRCGGGANHRTGLFDGILIKDNHIAASGGVTAAVERALASAPHLMRIEVECDTLEQAHEAVAAGADAVLLDNMAPPQLAEAVATLSEKCLLEASGGVNLDTVAAIAETGVDLVSVGALTHSAPALPFHLELDWEG